MILLLVFLATSAGTVRGRTFLKDGLPTSREDLDGEPRSSLGVLHLVFDSGISVQFGDQQPTSVPTTACSPDEDALIEAAIRAQLAAAGAAGRAGVETMISARRDSPICVYIDAQKAMNRLVTDKLMEKRVHFELKYIGDSK